MNSLVGQTAEDFRLSDLDGNSYQLHADRVWRWLVLHRHLG